MELNEAIELLETEMEAHGLLEDGWTYGFDKPRGERRSSCLLGTCGDVDKIIFISSVHAANSCRSAVLETIRHEIAHALVGGWHDHDEVWQAMAIRLGAVPSPCGGSTKSDVIQLGYEESE